MLGFMVGQPTNIASATTTTVKTGPGILIGYFVAAGTTPTVQAFDNTAASGTVIHGTATVATGTFVPVYAQFQTGLTVVTTGTGVNVTVVWLPA